MYFFKSFIFTIIPLQLRNFLRTAQRGHYRTHLVQQVLQRNIGTITAANCGQWCRYMQTYLPRCLNNEVVEG